MKVLNPMADLVKELQKMNEGLTERLDAIIEKLEILVEIGSEPDYG